MSGTVLIVMGVIGIAGMLLLLLVALSMMRGSRRTARKPAAAPADDAIEATGTAMAPAGTAPAPPGPRALLRAWEDEPSGRLIVEMFGVRYTGLAEMQDPAVYQKLLSTVRGLQAFAGLGAELAAVAPAAGDKPTADDDAQDLEPLLNSLPEPLVVPSMNPFKQAAVLRERSKVAVPPQQSIAEQIDEVLQRKLAGSGQERRGIRVRSGPKGTAQFLADGKEYEAVDELPDVAVRDLIRAAVAEWEKHK